MILVQVVPKPSFNAYRPLRDKVTHEARTWSWPNRANMRLRHSNIASACIEVGRADGVVIATIRPKDPADLYFLTEKFIGRLVAQLSSEPSVRGRRKRMRRG